MITVCSIQLNYSFLFMKSRMNIWFLPHGCCWSNCYWANTASLFSMGKGCPRSLWGSKSLFQCPRTSAQAETVSGFVGLSESGKETPSLIPRLQPTLQPSPVPQPPLLTGSGLGVGGPGWWGRQGASSGSLWCSPSAVGSQACFGAPTLSLQPHHCTGPGRDKWLLMAWIQIPKWLLMAWIQIPWETCSAMLQGQQPEAWLGHCHVRARWGAPGLSSWYLGPDNFGDATGVTFCGIEAKLQPSLVWCVHPPLQHCLLDYLAVTANGSLQS